MDLILYNGDEPIPKKGDHLILKEGDHASFHLGKRVHTGEVIKIGAMWITMKGGYIEICTQIVEVHQPPE